MITTVYDALATSAARFAERPFLHIPLAACRHYSDQPIDISYARMLEAASGLAAEYATAGYGLGQRVALVLENRPEFFIHWFALNRLGVSVVPINPEQSQSELAWLLEHSESCLVSSLRERADIVRAACALLENPPAIHIPGETLPEAPHTRLSGEAQAASECALLYTSGSTGKPKGCVLDNTYFLGFGYWYREIGGLCELREGLERLITPLPLSHMNAMATSAMGMLMSGGCIVQLDRFHPSSWWQCVRESGATIVHYLGVMPAILLNLPHHDGEYFASQLRFGFGAGVNPRHHAAFEERFGFPLIEAWAMTESGCGGCIIANREPRHVGSCCFGKANDAVDFKLVDEHGGEVPAGEVGELLVRAAGPEPRHRFFSGYLKNLQASAEIWQDGWLHTGDVVRQGEDGSLFFVDRRKNVIRRSGENIAALEVEAALSGDPHIKQVVVTAVPDEIRGDEVMACVVAQVGFERDLSSATAIQHRALALLAYFKVPGYVVFVDEIPRTPSQKPQRGEIKKLAAQWQQSSECFDLRRGKRRPGSST